MKAVKGRSRLDFGELGARTHRMLHLRSQTEEVAAAAVVAVVGIVAVVVGIVAVVVGIVAVAAAAAVAAVVDIVAARLCPESEETGCSRFAEEQTNSVGKLVADHTDLMPD